MNNYSVKNKIVIVTGATKGMGFASSQQLLKLGAKVVMIYCNDRACKSFCVTAPIRKVCLQIR